MSIFTSPRERRLWLWTLIVLVAIYSTLGLTGKLAALLRDYGLTTPFFIIGMVLVGVAALIQGIRVRPSGAEIGVAFGVAAAYLMVFTRMTIPEERTHLFEYGVVALFIFGALEERKRNGRSVWAPPVLAIVITATLGWIDEGIQALLPNRVYDLEDVGFNAIAAIMAIGASLAITWARRRWGKNKKLP